MTRDEFRAKIHKQFPGATIVNADRGLTIVVSTIEIAAVIAVEAKAAGLKVAPEEDGANQVRVFGFPRARKAEATDWKLVAIHELETLFDRVNNDYPVLAKEAITASLERALDAIEKL